MKTLTVVLLIVLSVVVIAGLLVIFGLSYFYIGSSSMIAEPEELIAIEVCPELWAPVCGEDGTTYANDCYARQARVAFTPGECVVEDTPANALAQAITFINGRDLSVLIPEAGWIEEDITENLGGAVYRYHIPDERKWEAFVRYPVVPNPPYTVEVFEKERGELWIVEVADTVEYVKPIDVKGTVVATAEGTRSESWGITVESPGEYTGQSIGMKDYAYLKTELEEFRSQRISVSVDKICRTGEPGCCNSAFEYCAPSITTWYALEP